MPKPEDIKLSALTKRIILTAKKYQELQILYTLGDYNKWCAGINKKADPNVDTNVAGLNYVEVGDAKNFSDLFITEREAELEEKEATNTEK